MVVGILQVELSIAWSKSLKDKRRVVLSIKDRLRRQHKVSVAEVQTQDHLQIATLGIAVAAGSAVQAQKVLDCILTGLANERDAVLQDHRKEILTGR